MIMEVCRAILHHRILYCGTKPKSQLVECITQLFECKYIFYLIICITYLKYTFIYITYMFSVCYISFIKKYKQKYENNHIIIIFIKIHNMIQAIAYSYFLNKNPRSP